MYHFIGIKGAGMSSLAQMMDELGYKVQGSDVAEHFFTEEGLIKRNIPILLYNEDNIKKDMIIIKGESIKDDNPEIKKAKELKLVIYSYSEMLGILTKKFKTICIAGCHGKTTTTAMTSHVLNNIKGTNYLIGDGNGYADKKNEFFVLESCEYKRHFLNYTPYYAVITNIDLDHVDYYKDINDIIDAYQDYANNATKMIIACGDDLYTHNLKTNKKIVYYGLDLNNDVIASNIKYNVKGISFDVIIYGKNYGSFNLPIYGKHMLLDALATITVCYFENIKSEDVQNIFKTFKGAKRRFSQTIVGNNIVIDDYAHHPNEIEANLNAIKQKYPNKKIIAIMQPHTFTRTKEFADAIADKLNIADEAYVMDIHPARELQEDYPDITSDIIIKKLKNGHKINIDEAYKLKNNENTVFAFMSPNDILKLENDLIEMLRNKNS